MKLVTDQVCHTGFKTVVMHFGSPTDRRGSIVRFCCNCDFCRAHPHQEEDVRLPVEWLEIYREDNRHMGRLKSGILQQIRRDLGWPETTDGTSKP